MMVAHGYKSLKVDNPADRIQVGIQSKEEVRPGTPATIRVTASGANTRMVVAVVDEGILAIRNFQTPDPYSAMYVARTLGVEAFDLYRFLLPELKQGIAAGGDAGWVAYKSLAPVQARRFRPLAWWSGIQQVHGSKTVKVDIPAEFNGRARIMAIAWDGRRFGSGEKDLVVREDVVMIPGLPRLIHCGDSISVPMALMNTSGKEGYVVFSVAAEGPIQLVGPPSQKVHLRKDGFADIEIPMVGLYEPGVARLVFRLSGLWKTEHRFELAVNPSEAPMVRGGAGSLEVGQEVEIQLPGGCFESLQHTQFSFSPFPVALFAEDLKYLLMYPHGCLEQTTSAVFPQLYFEELAGWVAPELAGGGKSAHHIKEAIRKLESMQLYSGGFSYWSGGDYISDWGSVYATHFLWEAKKAGFPVNASVLEKALDYLVELVNAPNKVDYFETHLQGETGSRPLFRKESTYALYVLALAGKATLPMVHVFEEDPKSLSKDEKVMVAAAGAIMGNASYLDQMLVETDPLEHPVRETGGVFDSEIRANALILSTLLDVSPGHPWIPILTKFLVNNRAKAYSTQDKAWLWLAFGKMAKKGKAASPKIEFWVDGKVAKTVEGPRGRWADPSLSGKRVRLKSLGKGTVYYSWGFQGYPLPKKAPQKTESKNLDLEVGYFDEAGASYRMKYVAKGDILWYRIRIRGRKNVENVAITAQVPSTFEIINPRLADFSAFTWSPPSSFLAQNMDFRDDRVLFYDGVKQGVWSEYWFQVRATATGHFPLPGVWAEAMYDPTLYARTPSSEIWVMDRPGYDPECQPADPCTP